MQLSYFSEQCVFPILLVEPPDTFRNWQWRHYVHWIVFWQVNNDRRIMIVFVIIFCRNQDLFLTLLKSFSNRIEAVTGQRRHAVVSNPASKLLQSEVEQKLQNVYLPFQFLLRDPFLSGNLVCWNYAWLKFSGHTSPIGKRIPLFIRIIQPHQFILKWYARLRGV